jgi:hypothetical protein
VHPVTLTVHPPGYRATDQTGATKDQAARHGARGLSNNGTASGDSGLKAAEYRHWPFGRGSRVRLVDQVVGVVTSSISIAGMPAIRGP